MCTPTAHKYGEMTHHYARRFAPSAFVWLGDHDDEGEAHCPPVTINAPSPTLLCEAIPLVAFFLAYAPFLQAMRRSLGGNVYPTISGNQLLDAF